MATTEHLIDAIKQKSEDLVLQLLRSGVDPNERVEYRENFDTSLTTPLLYATLDKDCGNIIKYLLNYGAKPSYPVLEQALMLFDISVIQELLKHGANAAYPPNFTESALHVVLSSAIKDKSKVCELLLKNGVQVNHLNKSHNPPLFSATDYDTIDVLLEHGAQVGDNNMHKSVLQNSFYLPEAIVKNMVRYAALQVRHSIVEEVENFYNNFFNIIYPLNQATRMMYLKFAQNCISEIKTMKELELAESCPTLFDFACCYDVTICSNIDVLLKVSQHLSTFFLSIYSEVIIKKVNKNAILNVLDQSLKLTSISNGGKVILNVDCMKNITKFLSKIDILNLITATYIS